MFRPWVVEPGLWLQWDYGHGPVVRGRQTTLWCAWLAWSRFRVVIPIWDKTLPTLANTRVWAREAGDEVVVTAIGEQGQAHEVARHTTGRPGSPVLDDAHYPPRVE